MKLKLSLLLVLIITYSWSQTGLTKTFSTSGTFVVPAGVTSINVQAWGGGGSGGGVILSPTLYGGTSGAGGGGGAYASAPLLVTPGTTLNVVVASQTSNNVYPVHGGESTITGFESSILAAGGSGGQSNMGRIPMQENIIPLGGSGGTIAASAGTIRLAGVNGENGNTWFSVVSGSSGAGGAGASGGAGGPATTVSQTMEVHHGNAGSAPGGGGSGAIGAFGLYLGRSPKKGGAGAAGQVIISYTCPTFNITSTTAATNVCAYTTAQITLTSSAALLPVGNYVVTYNITSPSGTTLTKNLYVTTAGTGTFTVDGLITAGPSTITITKLTLESCFSNITTNNTATITVLPSTLGGTVSGGTTIDSGNSSGLLTLSGHTGSVIKWQSSVSPFSTWTDIVNTNITYTSGALIETTQFRAVVQSGVCATANSAATTVTVNQPSTISLAASAENTISVAVLNNEINVNTVDQTINKVFVYDLSGNLLYKKDAVGNSKLAIGNLKSSNQILFVKIVMDNNHIETKKVIY